MVWNFFLSGDIQGAKTTEPKSDFYSVVQENITKVFDETGFGLTFSGSRTQFDLTSWDEVLEHYTTGFQTPSFHPAAASTESATVEDNVRLETSTLGEPHMDDLGFKQVDVTSAQDKSLWQVLPLFPSDKVKLPVCPSLVSD